MTISKKTALLGVNDLKIFPVTKDDASAFTTGSAIDVPGVRQISVTFDIDEKELTGDEKTLAVSSKIKGISFTSEYAELSLDVLAALSGGSVTVDTASDSSETAAYSFGEGDKPAYFQLQAKIDGTDSIIGGDVFTKQKLPQCRLTVCKGTLRLTHLREKAFTPSINSTILNPN